MEYKDYYEIMGLERDATQDEVKRAYRKLARKYHPDVSKDSDAEQKFKLLGEAYEVLKDPEKRAAYDQLGSNWKAGQEFRPPPDWDAGFEFSGGGFTGGDASAFSDFFETLFGRNFEMGRGRHTTFRDRGEDHHARVLIDLEDAYQGAARSIILQTPELDPQGHVLTRERTLNVRIPKGIREGQQIRLTGQGAPGLGGGRPGDLYLKVEFRPHRLYRIEGRDVYLDLPVAPWEAALGARVKAPTPNGVVDLQIPAGSTSGRRLRLKGRGIPGDPPGDIFAVLKISLPQAGNEKEKAFYRKMEQELAFNPRAELGV
jgi:curved DNA-binding protein